MADISQVDDGMALLDMSENENIFDKIRKTNATSSPEKMKDCFQFFDKDR